MKMILFFIMFSVSTFTLTQESAFGIENEAMACAQVSFPEKMYYPSSNNILLGELKNHIIQKNETLLDIARQYSLGFNDIQDLYPDIDPWIPTEGTRLIIPSLMIIKVKKR